MIEIEIPDSQIIIVTDDQLPVGWNNPIDHSSSQAYGMQWLASNTSLGLSVPSVISFDRSILINPLHPDFKLVKVINSIDDFPIDSRLTK